MVLVSAVNPPAYRGVGDFVRFSPNKLSIANVEAYNGTYKGRAINAINLNCLADIYGFNKNTTKDEDIYSAFRVNKHAFNTFNTTSKTEHRRKRRIMAVAFGDSVMPGYDSFISEKVDELTRKLGGKSKNEKARNWRDFNVANEAFAFVLDILGGLCFGEAFGFVVGKGNDVMEQIHKRMQRIHIVWDLLCP